MQIKNGAHAPAGSACLEKVLSALDKVKPAGNSKYKACCPAHDDKDPSLSIKESEDGTVLLHCWAGCTASQVVAAMGLELRDLFPGVNRSISGPSKAAIQHERTVYQIGISMQQQGLELSKQDTARLDLAKQRLGVSQ
ncbi:virulence-associated protein E [Pseudomonas sp. EL_65y_Pfl2_R95]|uniref:virulence-associated protein E n=1 Tax=Pseudomonas sp. EL_65y_Pfl2_R95 TaxID=3088698 RepID=UPI0030D82041